MNNIQSILLLTTLLVVSCAKELESPKTRLYKSRETYYLSREDGHNLMVKSRDHELLADSLINPYSMEIMQLACDSLCDLQNLPHHTLQPNLLYIRFLPQDSTEYLAIRSLGPELFNYPLHYEISEGVANYHDPTLNDDQMTWQYTTLPMGTTMPNVFYEVLDTCYIPQPADGLEPLSGGFFPDKTGNSAGFDFESSLEELACRIANPKYGVMPEDGIKAGGSEYPSGYLKVYNKTTNTYIPLRKIKVTAHFFVKTCTVYTDEYGHYVMNKKFSQNPLYSFKLENEVGFKVYDGYLALTPFNYSLGRHPKTGYTQLMSNTHEAWFPSAVSNCAYDFYKQCQNDNRVEPHTDLRIDAIPPGSSQGDGAPMLKHIGYQNLNGYSLSAIWSYILHGTSPCPSSLLYSLLRYLILPDIFILYTNSYNRVAEDVYHELSHAVHFKQSGTSAWVPFIYNTVRNYISSGGAYGNGTVNDSAQDIAELAEGWAYANQRIMQDRNGGVSGPGDYAGANLWFAGIIKTLYTLISSGVLTEAQISSFLTASVDSVDDLYNVLCQNYPSKKQKITSVFAMNHALKTQTVWKIVNATSSGIVLESSSGLFSSNTIADTVCVAGAPYLISSYTSLRDNYSTYYPSFVNLTVGNSVVYDRVGNSFYQILKGKSPFQSSSWTLTHTVSDVGDTEFNEFIFNLVPSDYQ